MRLEGDRWGYIYRGCAQKPSGSIYSESRGCAEKVMFMTQEALATTLSGKKAVAQLYVERHIRRTGYFYRDRGGGSIC